MPNTRKHTEPTKKSSMRIGERQKFALQLVARQEQISEATVIEKSAERWASELDLGPTNWEMLWDEEEAVRWLNAYSLANYKPGQKERTLIAFLFAHPQFFWADAARQVPRRAHAIILWPHRQELENLWRTTRDSDYWAAAKRMAEILKKAKLKVPEFG